MRFALITVLALSTALLSCSEVDRKKQQYISYGRLVYQKQCVNCHQADGNGYEKLYPPLNKADFLINDPIQSLCIIVNGAKGEMVVNGDVYNQPMPNFSHLKADELAKLLTYITNAWDNKGKLYTDKEIERALEQNCASK
ncbi:MAG: cytochrome c [Bacteroidia bacterium]